MVIQFIYNILMKTILTQNLAKYFLPGRLVEATGYNLGNGIKIINATRNAIKLIAHFFSPINVLTGKPVISYNTGSVIVQVFYFIPIKGQTLNNNTVNNLGETLSLLFGRPVELRLVKLHYPYLNSYILAQYIALNTQNYTFVQIVRRIFGSISPIKYTEQALFSNNAFYGELPLYVFLGSIVGIKIRVSGRLMTERSRPRQTVQTAQIGSFSKDNLSLIDYASFTSKNKKGSFTIKVWISQRTVSTKI